MNGFSGQETPSPSHLEDAPTRETSPPSQADTEGQNEERIAPTCCRFRLSGQDYYLAIEYMLEIAELPEITMVPMGPAYLRGLVNIRGEAIPVIDLSRFRGGGCVLTGEHRLIISDAGGEKIGFLIEGIPSLSQDKEGEEIDVVHFVRTYKTGVT